MAKNHLLNMMIFKLLVQGLQLIEIFHQFADRYNSHKQVSNMQIEIYLMHLIYFSKIYLLLSSLLIFIDNESYCSSEIKPECNWNYHEALSSTHDYYGQQDTFYYQPQPAGYNQRQQYHHDRTTKQVSIHS